MNKTFPVGARVRLTAKFLRNTGQYTGREPASVWTVIGHSGPWVIVDELTDTSIYTDEELASDPTLAFRRIHPNNLQAISRR